MARGDAGAREAIFKRWETVSTCMYTCGNEPVDKEKVLMPERVGILLMFFLISKVRLYCCFAFHQL